MAPGCYDLVDVIGWQAVAAKWEKHLQHAHNRLLTSIVLDHDERLAVAKAHCEQLAKAKGVVAMILPELGLGEWDREGADLHDQVGLNAFIAELANTLPSNVAQYRVKCHINDAEFADKALEIFDAWRADGTVQH